MLENHKRGHHGHLPLAGGVIVFVHIQDSLKQRFQVCFIKPGFRSQIGADKAPNFIKSKGNQLLAAHRAQLVFRCLRLFFEVIFHGTLLDRVGHCHPGDGDVQRQHRIKAFAKGDLNRSSNLPGIGTSGHDGAKGAHIIKELACLFPSGRDRLLFLGAVRHPSRAFGLGDMPVEVGRLLNDDVHARLPRICCLDIVANAALGCHVGDKTLHGFGIKPGGVAHIGIAVGVCIGAGDIVQKLIAILNGHLIFLLVGSRVFLRGFCGSRRLTIKVIPIQLGTHLIISKGKIRLLFRRQYRRNRIAYGACNLIPQVNKIRSQPFQLAHMIVGQAGKLTNYQSRCLAGRCIVAVNQTGIHFRHGQALNGAIDGNQRATVISRFRMVGIVLHS